MHLEQAGWGVGSGVMDKVGEPIWGWGSGVFKLLKPNWTLRTEILNNAEKKHGICFFHGGGVIGLCYIT